MKVDILSPPGHGGPHIWADDLKKALEKEGLEAKVICDYWGVFKRFFYTNADIIHSSAVPILFNLQGKKIILTVHGDYRKEKLRWKYLWPISIFMANIITTPSEFIKKELNLKGAIVIPNGIFPENFKCKKVKSKKKDKIKIVTLLGLKFWDKSRGVLELLKILEQVKKETKKKFEFTVIGGGQFLEKIKEESKKYDVPVNFVGFNPNPKEILQQSDIFIYYSFLDNMPLTILEAMACGLPVISNDIGAVKEMIGDNAVKDNEEFKKRLIKLIKKRGKVKNDIKKFDWNNLVKEYIEVYG